MIIRTIENDFFEERWDIDIINLEKEQVLRINLFDDFSINWIFYTKKDRIIKITPDNFPMFRAFLNLHDNLIKQENTVNSKLLPKCLQNVVLHSDANLEHRTDSVRIIKKSDVILLKFAGENKNNSIVRFSAFNNRDIQQHHFIINHYNQIQELDNIYQMEIEEYAYRQKIMKKKTN